MTALTTSAQRLATCRACPHRKEAGPVVTCRLCYCVMNAKVLLPFAKCPDKPSRWS